MSFAMSLSSLSANGFISAAVALSTQSIFSSRWKPVHVAAGTSPARASIWGSRSPNDSATGSIRSYGSRAVGKSFFAFATSPALTAFVNAVVRGPRIAAWPITYAL